MLYPLSSKYKSLYCTCTIRSESCWCTVYRVQCTCMLLMHSVQIQYNVYATDVQCTVYMLLMYNVHMVYLHCECVCSIPPASLTSMGVSIRTIQRSAAYTTGSSLILLCAPPPSGSGRGGLFGGQNHSSKALVYNFCYSLLTGKLASQVDLQSTNSLHCALTRGAGVERMGTSSWVGEACCLA